MKKITITGSSGFVGHNLSDYLAPFFELLKPSLREKNDVLGILNKSYCCVHLVGNNHNINIKVDDQEYFQVNTELTKKVFDEFLASTCEVFIYMSSIKAVADSTDIIIDEKTFANPITAYGKSKLAAENYILDQIIPAQKRVYILRPCMIHGPNNKGNLNLLYGLLEKGFPNPLGKFNNERSFLSVENLCFVINELIQNENVASGIYNVSDDLPVSTNEIVALIANSIQKNIWILNIPKSIIKTIAKIGDVLPLPINSERLQKLTENYVVSNVKIKQALGVNLPLSSKEGLLKTFKSFKE